MPAKVLVADDSPTIRRRAATTLAEAGYEVTCVEDGQAAWTALQGTESFAVLLCDILMPGIDGYELCHRVKSTPSLANLPVLLLRGTFEPWDQARAVDAGADGYVTKPFDSEALLSTLGEVLADVGGAALAAAPIVMGGEDDGPAPPGASVGTEAPASVPAAAAPFGADPEPPPAAAAAPAAPADEPLAASPFGMEAEGPADAVVFEPGPASPLGGEEPLEGSPLNFEPGPLAAAETGPPVPQPAEPLPESAPIQEPWSPAGSDPLSPGGASPMAPAISETVPEPAPASSFGAFSGVVTPSAATSLPPAPAAMTLAGLDEAMLERIAERVAARLVGRELERIAWDVVPDVAEAVIRKRLAEIEAHLGEE